MSDVVRLFLTLVGTSSDPCLLVDRGGLVVGANRAAVALFGIPDVAAGVPAHALLDSGPPPSGAAGATPPIGRPAAGTVAALLTAGWRTGDPVSAVVQLSVDGRRWWTQAWRLDTPLAVGGEAHLVVRLKPHERVVQPFAALDAKLAELADEVRRRKGAQRRLRRTAQELETIFGRAPIGMAVGELEHIAAVYLRRANAAMVELTGYDELSLSQRTLDELVEPTYRETVATAMAKLFVDRLPASSFEAPLRRPDGERVWVELSACLLEEPDDGAGELGEHGVPRVVLQVVDLSERRRQETQLRYLADHDPLTGLYNRRRFEEELRDAAASVRRYGTPTAVLMIDLDNFKAVNDAHGHAVGDELIGRVAELLRGRLRETDVIGRLGGDEFAALLPHTGRCDAARLAEELCSEIRTCAVGAAAGPLWVTATIGVADLTADMSTTHTAAEVLVEADAAMYEAKEAGRDRVAVVERQHLDSARPRAGHTWVQRIRTALHRDLFVLHAQPILDLTDGTVGRYELLLRMDAGDEGLVPPSAFLGIAEQFGLIHAIDRWVVDRAVALLEEWQADTDGPHRSHTVEVNLSGASITDARVVDAIERRIGSARIDATKLVFEITETAAIRSIDRARRFADRLGALGCTFALDDFGAGFGSLHYLKHLPADCLKIDGEFIRRLPEDTADQVTVKSIVQLARGLGKRTIAEFVDRPATVELLRNYGVDFAQGYHIGRPLPVTELDGMSPALRV